MTETTEIDCLNTVRCGPLESCSASPCAGRSLELAPTQPAGISFSCVHGQRDVVYETKVELRSLPIYGSSRAKSDDLVSNA